MKALIVLGPVVGVVAAAVLAWYGVEGWGWFLFVAVLLAPYA